MKEEKKLTDEDLINAVENCLYGDYKTKCKDCPFDNSNEYCKDMDRALLSLILRLQGENERLKDEKEEIRLFNLAIENGEIDMRIESEMAKSFYNSIIQIFEQNGATNFFTTTVDIDGKKGRYAFTIEKVGGQTVAEKLADQKAEIERLTEENKKLSIKIWSYEQPARTPLYSSESMVNCNLVTCYNENADLKAENAELQKQVDELKEQKAFWEGMHNRVCDELEEYNDKSEEYENTLVIKQYRITELQKQVDELTEKNKNLKYSFDTANGYIKKLAESCETNCKKFNGITTHQAVKDTANKVYKGLCEKGNWNEMKEAIKWGDESEELKALISKIVGVEVG